MENRSLFPLHYPNPLFCENLKPRSDAIVAGFGVQTQAILDIITGAAEPSGLLPMQMPANMNTVEAQYEDVPHDMLAYTDSEEIHTILDLD